MNEKFKEVLKLMEQNEELKKKYCENPPKTMEDFISIAKELGIELTKEELASQTGELTDEDLEKVAGGNDPMNDCWLGFTVVCSVFIGAAWYV